MHLFADTEATYAGIPAFRSLQDTLAFIREHHAGFDYLIITGDIAQDEQIETYRLLRDLIEDWVPRCRIVPGNHDSRAGIRSIFPEIATSENSKYLNFSIHQSGWNLIGMDSRVPGKVHGLIESDQAEWLQERLTENSSAPSLLFVHHHPVPVGTPWMDSIGLENSPAFSKVTSQAHSIKAIFTGHTHQDYRVLWDQLPVFGTPSTSRQFRPGTDEATFDHLPPGFRIINVEQNEFQTEVIRLPEFRYPPKQLQEKN